MIVYDYTIMYFEEIMRLNKDGIDNESIQES